MAFDKTRNYAREAEILKALGHPVRLKIVAGLLSEACNVKKIWECLELPRLLCPSTWHCLRARALSKGIVPESKCSIPLFQMMLVASLKQYFNRVALYDPIAPPAWA